MFSRKYLAVTVALLFSGGTASADVVITGWNLNNVSVSTTSPGTAGTSTIYGRRRPELRPVL